MKSDHQIIDNNCDRNLECLIIMQNIGAEFHYASKHVECMGFSTSVFTFTGTTACIVCVLQNSLWNTITIVVAVGIGAFKC